MDGSYDARIGSAAADVAVHRGDDLLVGGMGRLAEQLGGAEDHAGGAVTALKGALVEKGLLNWTETAVLLEALDGDNMGAADAADWRDAGTRGDAIEQYSAGPALALPAAVMGAGKVEMVAKHKEQ